MTIRVTGLISKNSLEYIHKAFALLNSGGLFINLANAEDSGTKGIDVSEVIDVDSSHGWYSGPAYMPNIDNSLAQIALTSGTEGTPKGVMISHAALANTTQRLIDIMEIDDSIREYVGVPVNFSFGFGRCRAVSAAKGRFFLPEHGFNPMEIAQMIESGEINSVSAVPTLWRLVLESPELFEECGKKLRWIEIGSQYMSAEEKRKLRDIFKNAKIVQHYGLTEASRSTFLDIQNANEEQLESVGKDYFGAETTINSEGRIRIRGPHLALSLLIDGEIQPLTDRDGWFTTNDSGHRSKDGNYLYFDGRVDDIINLGGTKLSPESLETKLKDHLKIEKSAIAIFRIDDPVRGDQICVATLESAEVSEDSIRSAIREILAALDLKISSNFPVYKVAEFPKTNTGKLKRQELSRRFSQNNDQNLKSSPQGEAGSATAQDLIEIWQDVLKISPISPQDNFFDIGGDSISAIRVTLRMEKAGVPKDVCRKIFEGYSIENLVASFTPNVITSGESSSEDIEKVHDRGTSEQMISIWSDVLKIDTISVDDSFFDLGGDSLSAIRVVTRMEKAGIPKDICRKIFEGHSIRNILELNDSSTPKVVSISGADEDKAEELIAIWKDILKIENVTADDSFFDLGGDSLSAIRVVTRMEAAGIPKDTCRKVFEGHSIKAIVSGGNAVATNITVLDTDQSDKSKELIDIWQDVLKVDNVTENDSFFDLGGDSLSAIRVVVRMEAAGIPKDTCRKIFEGHSIKSIVGDSGAIEETHQTKQTLNDNRKSEPKQFESPGVLLKRTSISSANLSLNVIRGLLVALNIAAHWMPGVIARLPAFTGEINKYFAPLYSSGTPGFALVFGAGLSFFILPRYNKNKSSVNKLCIRNAIILGTGISFMAAIVIAVRYFNDLITAPTDVSNAFYSVLFYYFFAVISIPLWLRLLTWKGSFRVSCLVMACIFYSCHMLIDWLNIPPSENPLIQTGILILTPKYNYLEMTAAVMLGAAAGSWIKEVIEEGRSILPVLTTGILLVALAIVTSFETGDSGLWFVWPKGLYIWTWPFYLGCVLICFYYLFGYIEKHDIDSHPRVGFVLRVLSVVGVMAFPLFIGHEIVRPFAMLLDTFSVPAGLTISMLLFFGYSFFLLKKLYGLYYTKGS